DEFEIPLHAGGTIYGSPPKPQLHRTIAVFLVSKRLGRKIFKLLTIEPARINGKFRFCSTAQQAKNRLPGSFGEDIPNGDVDGADRGHADALPSPRHRSAIHVLP